MCPNGVRGCLGGKGDKGSSGATAADSGEDQPESHEQQHGISALWRIKHYVKHIEETGMKVGGDP
jgi:hypothetical protein